MCKLLQGAGNEAEENPETAEEVLEARGSEAAFESAMGAAARVGL
jgi:uncharacterized protein (DUF4213/DUF364 family)